MKTTTERQLQRGDLVQLKQPYQGRFTHGIVVEITATIRGQISRNVSLHLYDKQGQLYFTEDYLENGLMILCYVDFHVSELVWYKRADETG
ncbi:MAG: hypothetical protein AAGG53_03670 [Cyanobacteria bacterium P01_H01_bin.152]